MVLYPAPASLATTKKAARVPNPFVWAVENTSATFTCESGGEPLTSCLWVWNARGQRKVIIVDGECIIQQGGALEEGTFSALGGFGSGRCSMKIEFSSVEHTGPWSCTLLSHTGEIFTGEVNVKGKF